MTRRTYHLPPHLDRALAKHAEAHGTTCSKVVRDALSVYLMVEGASHRLNFELDALREELRLGLAAIHVLLRRLPKAVNDTGKPDPTDRVRARFDQLITQGKPHENGHR